MSPRSSAARVVDCTVQSTTAPVPSRLAAVPARQLSGAFRPLPRATTDPRIPLAEQQRLWCAAAKRGDEAAASALLDSIRNFVLKTVNRFARSLRAKGGIGTVDVDDMESAAWDAIVRYAIPKFELERGFTVITYFKWWIDQACARWLADHMRQVRVPVFMHDRRMKIRATRAQLRVALGREPEPAEVGAAVGFSAEQVLACDRAFLHPVALDGLCHFDDGDGDALVDRMPVEELTAEEQLARESLRLATRRLLRGLRARDADVIRRRYEKGETLKEVGERWDISRERVRQIEDQTIARLRAKAARVGFER